MKSSKYYYAWLDIGLILTLYLFFVWIFPTLEITKPLATTIFIIALLFIFYFCFISPRIHGNTLAERGLGKRKHLFIKTSTLKNDIKIYGVFAALCLTILLVAINRKMSTVGIDIQWDAVVIKYIMYLFSATIQDLIMLSLLILRLKVIVDHHMQDTSQTKRQLVTVTVLSLFFCVFHLPNPPLMMLALAGSFCIGWIYYKHPNLFLVLMCHAFFGTFLHRVYQLHMRFGHFYGIENTQSYFIRKIVPGLELFIGNRW